MSSRRCSQIEYADGRREDQRKLARNKSALIWERKFRKNSSRRYSQIENADGRRAEKKRVLLFMIFVEGLKSSFRFIP